MAPAIIGHNGVARPTALQHGEIRSSDAIGAQSAYLSNFEFISMEFEYGRASKALPISGKIHQSFRLWSYYVRSSYPNGRNR